MSRISRKVILSRATPNDDERKKVKNFNRKRKVLNRIHGLFSGNPDYLESDHIIPLRGKTVCGLNCIANIQMLPHYINTLKANKLLSFNDAVKGAMSFSKFPYTVW